MNTFWNTSFINEVNLDIKKLQEVIVDALDDIKARDITVFDTTRGTAEFDRVIIATAEVARQTKAMAMNVIEKVKQAGGRIVSMEGGESGEWVLVDCSDAIVHIMQPAVREFYNLEELWGQKKVAVMTAAEKAADAARRAAQKAVKKAIKKSTAGKSGPAIAVNSPARGVAKKVPGKPVKKAVKKVVQRTRKKVVTVKKLVAKKSAVRKAGGKTSGNTGGKAGGTTGGKKAPAKKAATRKLAAKK